MGKRKKIWSGFGRAVVLCAGLGFVLAGCAVQKSETGSRKPELAEVKIPNLEDFTTIGKPTKTIQTPNGPVEVYDPTQDPEVRAAFQVVYDKNAFPVTSNGYPRDKNENPVHGKEGDLLVKARGMMVEDIIQKGACKKLRDATGIGVVELEKKCRSKTPKISNELCRFRVVRRVTSVPRSSLHPYKGLREQIRAKPNVLQKEHLNFTLIDTVPAATEKEVVLAYINGKTVISTDYKIIGPISPEPFDEQVKWFFSYHCFN